MSKNNFFRRFGGKFNSKIREKVHHLKSFLKYFLDARGISSGKMISLDELSRISSFVDILYKEKIKLHYAAPTYNISGAKSEMCEGIDYLQYALHLKNVSVLGDSNIVIFPGNKVLYDLSFYDASNKFVYKSDFGIIKVKKKKIIFWKGKKHEIKKAIWMGGNFSWNYYHLLYEFITKFRKLETLNIPVEVPVLIDEVCCRVPQFKELINMVNTKGYKILTLKRMDRYCADELYYINCLNFIPPNIVKQKESSSDVQFDLNILGDLRRFLLPFSSQRKFSERVFISRKNASDRRVFNEEEVIAVFTAFGFTVYRPEEYSVADQISLFNQAEWIAGGSGAAFSNILFCNNNSKIILFFSFHSTFSGFSTIAKAVGADLRYITEADTNVAVSIDNIHEAFAIDIPYLINCLKTYGL
jgi:hypothetical protein